MSVRQGRFPLDVGVSSAPSAVGRAPFAEGETHRGEHASGRLAEGEGRSPTC
ncbi:MAG: hypothetical protein JWO86_4070 [Myxococcaceae bacterium]|nr:hypothetical protein [Myxococcaceae bacterium]